MLLPFLKKLDVKLQSAPSAPEPEGTNVSTGLANQAARKLGERVCGRYLNFLRREQYERLTYLHIWACEIDGCFLPNFRDHRSLYNFERLAKVSGIPNLSRQRWNSTIPQLAPLATLEGSVEEGSCAPVGALLAMGMQPMPCPVFLIVGPSLRVHPLAETLDAFIGGESRRPSARGALYPFEVSAKPRFRWAPEPADDFPHS